jgi:phosphonate transport system substrate-binding protein
MIRRAVLTVLALAVLSGCAPAKPPERPEIVFSILSAESQASSEADWQPFLDDMAKALGRPVKAYYGSNYTALIEAMRFKQTDLGWFSNQSGLEAVRRANGEVFVRTFDPSGTDGYQSVIIVPKDSPITSVEQLLKCDRTLNFGIGDAKSTSGTLAPKTYLFSPRGIDPETCFKTVKSANHQANLFAVANGTLDAATNNSTSLALNAARGQAQSGQIRVIWTSPTIPEDPLVWRKDLDPVVKEKLRQFFLTYGQGEGPDAARQRANLKQLSMGGFKAADNTHLLPVRRMEATELLSEATKDGDAAKIATARKQLDEVIAEQAALQAKSGVAGS